MSHGVASKKYIELAGADSAEGVMLPAGKLAIYDALPKGDVQYKLLKDYDQSYKKAYGTEASTFGGYAYDAFLLATGAIKKVGSTPEQIRKGIEQTNKLVSVSGIFTMSPKDHNGLDLSAFEMVKVLKGDWSLLK
jgi:branched-chain amino acid transport system substrate-binding protein